MQVLRSWSVRHARALQTLYGWFERASVALDPLFHRIGYERLELPVARVERAIKGALFDCRMCGRCVLGSTGMSCPMNCPKNLRNGPCGGVRADGRCEVKPQMPCVWVEAYAGSRRMRDGDAALRTIQVPVDWRMNGRSAWLAAAREKSGRAA